MIKYESLQKVLTIAAATGILMLLLSASSLAQSSPEMNVLENCTCTCPCHQPSREMDTAPCAYSSVPERATLVSPKDAIGTANPTFVWNPAENSTRYCLKVASASQPNTPIFEECYDTSEVLSDWGCSVKPTQNLAAGSYRWWINTSNCKGEGGWSRYMEFDYQPGLNPGRSTPISPMGLISAKTPTFKWTAATAATEYNLQVKTDDDIMVANVWFDAEKVTRGDLCSALSPVVLPDEVYFWSIRACIDGNCEPSALIDSDWQYFENVCAFKPRAAKIKARMIDR
ncbi:MAG: hypothetical protein MUE87_01000 [Methanothrix sp.]|nr:hypothetical protein [Methanothrix sp.]